MGNKGITLVSLVITIIVMLILAGVSLSMLVGDGSVLDQAKNASTATVLGSIKEEFELNKTGRKMKEVVNANGKINKSEDTGIYAMGTEVLKYIPNIDKGYIGKVGIFNDELVFIGEELTEEDKAAAQGLGYTLMDESDYTYMSLMIKMEKLIKGKNPSLGVALTSATEIPIAGINYGASWYKITEDKLADLGFSPEELSIVIKDERGDRTFGGYAPFVVRFDSGELLSSEGKKMYKGTDMEITKYTFNYKGEKDGIVITDLMAGVDKSSVKSKENFGAFSSKLGEFDYDTTDNGLKFTGGTIGTLAIDQSVSINKEYSINLTVKCDVNQKSPENAAGNFPTGVTAKHHRSMIAISDDPNEYICWMGVDGGILRVYNFRAIMGVSGWNVNPTGYLWADVTEYNNKYMNIQFTAVKGGDAKLYINGELKATGKAGNYDYSYKTLTIGDLREGRGLKYLGNMYNVSLYGRALTEAEVMQNYQAIKKELGF